MLIMKLSPLPGRDETGIPLRLNALDPGFHYVLAARHTRSAMLMVPV
jgi:hypothetical protein